MKESEIQKLLKPFSKKTIETINYLRAFVKTIYPEANEIFYDNYNALAIGWSLSDKQTHIICSHAIYHTNENIHFGFMQGTQLKDPDKILLGQGKIYRYVLVSDKSKFPKEEIKKIMSQAYILAMSKLKDQSQTIKGQTILKSISSKKRK